MSKIWDLRSMLQWMTGYLQEKRIADARLEAELLLAQAVGQDRLYLYTHYDQPLTPAELARLKSWLLRRVAGESAASDVLVPRGDTEVWVAEVLARRGEQPQRVLDVGTGSGAILGSLLHYRANWQGVAVDISPAALGVAAENFDALGVASRIELRESDLCAALAGETFDILVSNPPYIPTGAIPTLAAEVQNEPHTALDGGTDGLDVMRRLVAQAAEYVVAGGLCAVEIGYEQGRAVEALVQADGRYTVPVICRDLSGHDRAVLWEVKA